MTRWKADIHPKPPPEPPDIDTMITEPKPITSDLGDGVTDDPLAALGLTETGESGGGKKHHGKRVNKTIYAVSRTPMHLPRVTLKNNGNKGDSRDSAANGGGMQDGEGHFYLTRGEGVNPLYQSPEFTSNYPATASKKKKVDRQSLKSHRRSPSLDKSGSSGYSGSNEENSLEPVYATDDHLKLIAPENVSSLVEHDPKCVKSLRVTGRGLRSTKSVPSHSSSSGAGTLSTIPEGKVDLPIPQPVWPPDDSILNQYDSLVDDALLLYTSFDYVPENRKYFNSYMEMPVNDLLVDLLTGINETLEAKTSSAEEMLKIINEKIKIKLQMLNSSTEEDMKKLCVNMSNSKKINSIIRAFSHSSSSGQSTSSCQAPTSSSNEEDLYHIPSNSSVSGLSDSPTNNFKETSCKCTSLRRSRKTDFDKVILKEPKCNNFSLLNSSKNDLETVNQLSAVDLLNKSSIFIHEDLNNLSKGARNALIYGTLYRNKYENVKKPSVDSVAVDFKLNLNKIKSNGVKPSSDSLSESAKNYLNRTKIDQNKCDNNDVFVVMGDTEKKEGKKRLLGADGDQKPSVWQQYYGVRAEGAKGYGIGNPSNVPVYPGGRPEADFTLDLSRSELLSKRLRKDKKWRCRCRLLTSFLGLVFFILSVMVVSLILTRGKRIFGSMA